MAPLPYPGAAWNCCSMQTVYEAAGGADFFLLLANAWHARATTDAVVSHAFSHGFHPEHQRRLAAYWAEALGGPPAYSASYGDETSVVRMHSGNGPHEEMDRRAIACFDQALTTSESPTTAGSGKCCTTTSPGRPPSRCPGTALPRRTSRKGCPSKSGPGTGLSTAHEPRLSCGPPPPSRCTSRLPLSTAALLTGSVPPSVPDTSWRQRCSRESAG